MQSKKLSKNVNSKLFSAPKSCSNKFFVLRKSRQLSVCNLHSKCSSRQKLQPFSAMGLRRWFLEKNKQVIVHKNLKQILRIKTQMNLKSPRREKKKHLRISQEKRSSSSLHSQRTRNSYFFKISSALKILNLTRKSMQIIFTRFATLQALQRILQRAQWYLTRIAFLHSLLLRYLNVILAYQSPS